MKVVIKDYQAIKNAELTFDKGLTAIIGPTNSGKSSIIRAIKGAINNQGGNSFINYDADQAIVNIEDNGSTISWVKNKKGPSSYIINGEELSKIGTKQNEDVANLLNMNEIEVGTSKIRLNFWDQMEKAFLMDRNPGQLFSFISQSKEQEVITEYQVDKKKDIDHINNQVRTIHTTVNILTDEIRELKLREAKIAPVELINTDVIKYLYEVDKATTDHLSTLQQLDNNKDQVTMKLNNLNKHLDTLNNQTESLTSFIDLHTNLDKIVKQYEIVKTSKVNTEEQLNKINTELEKSEAVITNLDSIIATHSVLRELQNKTDILAEKQLPMQMRRLKLMDLIKQADEELIKAQEELDSIQYCPYCNSDLTKGDHNHAK